MKTQEIWLENSPSTMKEARNISPDIDFGLVSTRIQTNGRGTKGSVWLCQEGNIFITLAISHKCIHPQAASLLPLLAGICLYEVFSEYLIPQHRNHLFIKWPNDILIEGKKVSGVLIEADSTRAYIGIGINSTIAPEVRDGGRTSGSLTEFSKSLPENKNLILQIYRNFQSALHEDNADKNWIQRWSQYVNWDEKIFLRNNPNVPLTLIGINPDGSIQVRDPMGQSKRIISEYLA